MEKLNESAQKKGFPPKYEPYGFSHEKLINVMFGFLDTLYRVFIYPSFSKNIF